MGVHRFCINLRGKSLGEKGKGGAMSILFELVWIFFTSAVKTVAKVLVKNYFDKQKATLTSTKRNIKGSNSKRR